MHRTSASGRRADHRRSAVIIFRYLVTRHGVAGSPSIADAQHLSKAAQQIFDDVFAGQLCD
jgi:hypothetical protein